MFTTTYRRLCKLSMWNSFKKRVVFYARTPCSPSFPLTSSPRRRIHCRPLSTAAERQYDVYSPQTKGTFVYTDYSKIEDEKKQGCFLTKSILKPGLPSIYERPLNLDQSLLHSIYEEFEGHLLDSFLFCFGEEELHRKKFSVMNSFLNMAQTTWRKTTSRYQAARHPVRRMLFLTCTFNSLFRLNA